MTLALILHATHAGGLQRVWESRGMKFLVVKWGQGTVGAGNSGSREQWGQGRVATVRQRYSYFSPTLSQPLPPLLHYSRLSAAYLHAMQYQGVSHHLRYVEDAALVPTDAEEKPCHSLPWDSWLA